MRRTLIASITTLVPGLVFAQPAPAPPADEPAPQPEPEPQPQPSLVTAPTTNAPPGLVEPTPPAVVEPEAPPIANGSLFNADPNEGRARSSDPFGWADWTWLTGNPRTPDNPLKWGPFTGEFRLDTVLHYSFNHPKDDTIGGSSEVFRHGENQVTQIGFGGDFNHKDVHGRLMTQFGMYSQTTPRNDPTPERGQWNLADAYRYISEGYAGYHINKFGGINIQAGIFMSYVGLWSYYNFDNWTYQPSYVSSNTPWFFNGMRIQWFPTPKLKIEPWFVNGWQAYGRYNNTPGSDGFGGGGQILWRPTSWLSILGNQYYGADTLGVPDRKRIHTDDSIQIKWYENAKGPINRVASTLTVDAGCEWGGGVSCFGGNASSPSQYFLGFMAYTRAWFGDYKWGATVGGGTITNPGRYLVLVPPINGATAFSGAAPFYTYNPGDPFKAWDTQVTLDYMPRPYITFRAEFNYRHASIPYFSGPNGVTPPGGNQGAPGSVIDGDGDGVPDWEPDLVKNEPRLSFAMLLKL
jgi:hypothetical protein